MNEYLRIDDRHYLTPQQAIERLERSGAYRIERRRDGLLYWRCGRGSAMFAADPIFVISKHDWYYALEDLE
jgi:hypothetical protein